MEEYGDPIANEMCVAIVRAVPDSVSEDLALLAALIAAVDGEVSEEEIAFLRSLA